MHKNLADTTIGGTSANLGTAGVGVTASEHGDAHNHVTHLALSGVPITIGDTAALAMGALIYTLPAGLINVHSVAGSVGLTLTTGTPTTDTPEMAVGTTLASGAVATIGAADAAAENMAGPVASLTDIAGTASLMDHVTQAGTTSSAILIAAADDHTVYINFADTWANVDDTAATADGDIWIQWTLLA